MPVFLSYWVYVRKSSIVSNGNGKSLFRFFCQFIQKIFLSFFRGFRNFLSNVAMVVNVAYQHIFKCFRVFCIFDCCWVKTFYAIRIRLTLGYTLFQCIGMFWFWAQLILTISLFFVKCSLKTAILLLVQ